MEPLLNRVLHEGKTVAEKDRLFRIARRGYLEDAYFDISCSPVRDDTGAVQGVMCIIAETTERVLSDRSLAQSEEQLQAIFAQSAGGIAITDVAGRFVFVNDRFCDIVGYDEPELLGLRMQDITYPDDLPANMPLFAATVNEGSSFEIEKRYVRKDGSLVWVRNSVGPIRDAAGNVYRVSAMVFDINDRKRAELVERRLASIISSSDDAILSIDLDTVITSWNRGAEILYGYTEQEAIGRSVEIIIPPDRSHEEAAILERIRRGERVEPHETIRQRKDGSQIHVSLTVSPVHDEYGNVVGASKIARDITARKEVERLQQVLMGELKHRVKNILATVQAVARQTFSTSQDLQKARDVFDARLQSLANAHDLLTREAGDGADMSQVLAEVLAPYQQDQFEMSGPPLLLPPKSVLAVSLALHELATNAAKYGALSTGTGRVQINWGTDTASGARFFLRWQEQGGPTVVAPARRGFGSRLIEGLLAAELNGEVSLNYPPEGVVCTVDAQLDNESARAG